MKDFNDAKKLEYFCNIYEELFIAHRILNQMIQDKKEYIEKRILELEKTLNIKESFLKN